MNAADGGRKAAAPDNSRRSKTTVWQAAVLMVVAVGLFFALLEGGLALFGVQPVLRTSDPFVGFAGNVPLFDASTAPNGNRILQTADNKLKYFNRQMFVEQKAADTYRIFCLGGSTTYGRPYNDLTSFAGWLRELLPAADPRRDWEVINAGGISYASYRVARLMEDLVQYQPDLFIVYTGQNEFLEERTYRELREVPEAVRTTVGWLARTRTWAAMSNALRSVGLVPEQAQPQQVELPAEVDTILDHSAGPTAYQRDDALQATVLEHYRLSLERMVAIADQAGARLIFVTPASNLKDFSPFKSEHTAGLAPADRQPVEQALAAARQDLQEQDPGAALARLDEAAALDPRFAELHFLRGRALFGLQRYTEAHAAFKRARDEDVCPLRALTPMREILAEVARDHQVPLVDFVALVEQWVMVQEGHPIAGDEAFLDHVHPTIDGHRLLAVNLVDRLIEQGLVQPDQRWGEALIAAVDARIRARIDPELQARGLLNLAKVLHWAGKFEDARRLASRALVAAEGVPRVAAQANHLLVKIAKLEGDVEQADRHIAAGLDAAAWNPQIHYQLGVRQLQEKVRRQGAAHILLASAFWDDPKPDSVLGLIFYRNGRLDLAYPLVRQAVTESPGDLIAQRALAGLQTELGARADHLPPVAIAVRRYPSGAPREIFTYRGDDPDNAVPDGIYTEWYQDGTVKTYADYARGALHGYRVSWGPAGALLETAMYKQGQRLPQTGGEGT